MCCANDGALTTDKMTRMPMEGCLSALNTDTEKKYFIGMYLPTRVNNKVVDQTIQMPRLICAFIACIGIKQVFT